MNAVPLAANSVQLTYTRSWKGLPTWLSTVMYCLSRNGFAAASALVTPALARTYRPGKFQDPPALWVERKTRNALETSGLGVVGLPRWKTWQEKYALPLVSQATEVSPPACQYWRATLPKSPVETAAGGGALVDGGRHG